MLYEYQMLLTVYDVRAKDINALYDPVMGTPTSLTAPVAADEKYFLSGVASSVNFICQLEVKL